MNENRDEMIRTLAKLHEMMNALRPRVARIEMAIAFFLVAVLGWSMNIALSGVGQ